MGRIRSYPVMENIKRALVVAVVDVKAIATYFPIFYIF